MYLWPWSFSSHQKWNNYISQTGQPANLCYIVPPVLFWFCCNPKLTFYSKTKNTAMKNRPLLARCWLWLYESREKFGSAACHSHLIKSCWRAGSPVGGLVVPNTISPALRRFWSKSGWPNSRSPRPAQCFCRENQFFQLQPFQLLAPLLKFESQFWLWLFICDV